MMKWKRTTKKIMSANIFYPLFALALGLIVIFITSWINWIDPRIITNSILSKFLKVLMIILVDVIRVMFSIYALILIRIYWRRREFEIFGFKTEELITNELFKEIENSDYNISNYRMIHMDLTHILYIKKEDFHTYMDWLLLNSIPYNKIDKWFFD